MMELFDSHAHLNGNRLFNEVAEITTRATENQVKYILNVGYDLETCKRAVEIGDKYPNQYAAVGIHPNNAKSYNDEIEEILEELAANPKVVAIGEAGLDYHHDLSPKGVQKEVFLRQIALARKLDKPIVIHDREAHQDVMDILKAEKLTQVVMHCFSGSAEMAIECVKLGWYVSLAGPVTFRNAKKPVEVAKVVPLDRLLIETDSPYLAPQAVRGQRNEPSYVRYVAEKIAEVKGISLEEVAEHTTANAKKIFRIS